MQHLGRYLSARRLRFKSERAGVVRTMADKRYQVFISSTFVDLPEERQAVFQTLMKMDCIPAGMELFPAADEEQFEFIKKVIDDCDYYIVIIGGRYGSAADDGLSYTEKEYDYAVQKGIKVIALLHKNPGKITGDKLEAKEDAKARLDAFRLRVQTGRLVDFWETPADLHGVTALAMINATKMFPAVGWVRANQVASLQTLGEINELRKANDELRAELQRLGTPMAAPDIASLDEVFSFRGTSETAVYGYDPEEWTRNVVERNIHCSRYPDNELPRSGNNGEGRWKGL